MNYSLVQYSDGTFHIISEHGNNLQAAKIAFHNLCAALWNESSVGYAMVKIVDNNWDCVDGHMELITHGVEEEENVSEDI